MPLILIHGGNYGGYDCAEDWSMNIGALAKHHTVYAIDKIGCGFTDNPLRDEDYIIGASVKQVYDFMGATGIDKAHVAGHSRGGYTATRFALEHPEAVLTLTIVSSSSLITPPNPQYDMWDQEASKISDFRERIRYLVAVNSFSAGHITDALLDVMVKVIGLDKSKAAAAKMEAGLKKQFKEDLVARQKETHEWIRSGRLKCPTLILWGANDPSATMERCGIPCMNLVMPSVPRSEMHILNQAGHYCFREQPDSFNSTLGDFLARNS